MTEERAESRITVGSVLIGKYRVTREIGRGGMAAVYEAMQLALGKKVAVKVLAADLSASTTVIERFFREARAAASVKSPYIIDIYDSGRLDDGRPFIAMEMLEGETLYDLMTRVRLIDKKTTVRIITQCAKGLAKAHAVGIVHRDLKPENIFLTVGDDGEPTIKILDFGLAKFYAPVSPDEKTARLTREGAVFGTPAYMSPEQVKGVGTVDHRADLWALGCMTFECLTGRPVWNTEQGVAMTFAAIAAAALPVPSQFRPDLPRAFDDWFGTCLQRDPVHRFQSAKDLADGLARALGESIMMSMKSGDMDVSSLRAGLGAQVADLDDSIARARNGVALALPSVPSVPDSGRNLAPSAVDVPGTTSPTAAPRLAKKSQAGKIVLSSLGLAGSSTLAVFAWTRMLGPQVMTEIVKSTATEAPEPAVVADAGLPPDTPKWQTSLEDGQQLFAVGDLAGAQEKFRRSQELGAPGGVVRAYLEETKAGLAGTGDCKMAAFSRPRTGIGGNALRPTVASNDKRTLVAWVDDHEQPGHEHVYGVPIDASGRAEGRPRDLTPEAASASHATLLSVGDRMALLYADRTGPEVGVRVRWIDDQGRIAGPSMLVGGVRPGPYWPAFTRAPDGFFVAWEDERDKDGAELYLRHLGRELEPIGPEVRATDYVGPLSKAPQVRTPGVAVGNNALYAVYKLEQSGKTHLIERLRVSLDASLLGTGIEPRANATKDKFLGDVQLVNDERTASDSPGVACGREGCFVSWHGEKGGAFIALIDPNGGKVVWHKKFAERGGAPDLGVSDDGTVAVAFYEGGWVRMAKPTRDGIGPVSAFARVSSEAPRPEIAPGRVKGEWFVTWQESEGARTEAYVARVVCK